MIQLSSTEIFPWGVRKKGVYHSLIVKKKKPIVSPVVMISRVGMYVVVCMYACMYVYMYVGRLLKQHRATSGSGTITIVVNNGHYKL